MPDGGVVGKADVTELVLNYEINAEISRHMDAGERATSRMYEAAERYAAWDRSDPFSRARMETHIRVGVASIDRPRDDRHHIEQGRAYYNADSFLDKRRVSGPRGEVMEIPFVNYRNLARP